MGNVTSLFVRKVVGLVSDNLNHVELLRSVGVTPDADADPKLMVDANAYYTMLERIFEEDRDGHSLSMRAGESMRCDDYGALGLAMKSAPTLRETYHRAERYARVLTNVTSYQLVDDEDGGFLFLHRQGERRRGLCMSNEASLAANLTIAREVSGTRLTPTAVYFKHAPPPGHRVHERFFGCPVVYASDRDALHFSNDTLALPNRLGDESITKFFDTHLEEELAKLQDDSGLDQRVRIQIAQVLSDGVPKISDIASRLGISGRTLQRRLSESGLSFQTLVDESRRELAERLLRHTQYSLAEVSFLTGFSEQSAFTRAFKRWAGQTPRSFRLQSRDS